MCNLNVDYPDSSRGRNKWLCYFHFSPIEFHEIILKIDGDRISIPRGQGKKKTNTIIPKYDLQLPRDYNTLLHRVDDKIIYPLRLWAIMTTIVLEKHIDINCCVRSQCIYELYCVPCVSRDCYRVKITTRIEEKREKKIANKLSNENTKYDNRLVNLNRKIRNRKRCWLCDFAVDLMRTFVAMTL